MAATAADANPSGFNQPGSASLPFVTSQRVNFPGLFIKQCEASKRIKCRDFLLLWSLAMDENAASLSAEVQVRRRSWCVVGVKLYNQLHITKKWLHVYINIFICKRMQTVWWDWRVLLRSLTAAAAPWAAFCWWQPHRCLWTSEKWERRGPERQQNLVFLLKQARVSPVLKH